MTDIRTATTTKKGRLDAVLSDTFGLGRRQMARVIRAGGVLIAGRRCSVPSEPVDAGVEVEMNLDAKLTKTPVDIVYENDQVWILHKPAGVPTEQGRGGGDALTTRLAQMKELDKPPAASHRLDLRASGLVAVAKTSDALRKLNAALRARTVERGYVALVRSWAAPQAQRIDEPLSVSKGHVSVSPNGAEAVTRVEPLGHDLQNGVGLVAVRLRSGRQHQARVHLSWAIGAIVGDRRYGDLLSDAPRVALHAGWLAWGSDTGLEPVRVSIPPAADFWSLCPRTLQLPESWPTRLGFAGETV